VPNGVSLAAYVYPSNHLSPHWETSSCSPPPSQSPAPRLYKP
jgi:hypothetical protein